MRSATTSLSQGVKQSDPRAGQDRKRARSGRAGTGARSPSHPATPIAISPSASRSRNRIWTGRSRPSARCFRLAPRHALARYNLALVLRRADRLPEALAELERIVEDRSPPGSPLHDGGHLLAPGRARPCDGALRAAIAAEPEHADAHYALGSVLKARRTGRGSTAALRRADRDPSRSRRRTTRSARCCSSVGDDAGGARGVRTSRAPSTPCTHSSTKRSSGRQSVSRRRSPETAGAVDNFRRATAIFDAYAPAHYQLGLRLRRLGEHDAARVGVRPRPAAQPKPRFATQYPLTQ